MHPTHFLPNAPHLADPHGAGGPSTRACAAQDTPWVVPVTLAQNGVRLEPMTASHAAALAQAAADGELWRLRVTSVPAPGEEAAYVATALRMQAAGTRLPFVVVDEASGQVLGSSSYHDIVPAIRRLEIGYTWYARSARYQVTKAAPMGPRASPAMSSQSACGIWSKGSGPSSPSAAWRPNRWVRLLGLR